MAKVHQTKTIVSCCERVSAILLFVTSFSFTSSIETISFHRFPSDRNSYSSTPVSCLQTTHFAFTVCSNCFQKYVIRLSLSLRTFDFKAVEMPQFLQAPAVDTTQMEGSTSPPGSPRSPRTPTYMPSSPTFANVRPFDPTNLFSVSSVMPAKGVPLTKRQPRAPARPPPRPQAWIWQCHMCNNRWRLGATRRCLVDGHYYCSGQSQINVKPRKKGQSCSSEFDYVGWRLWGDWKQKAGRAMEDPKLRRGCETCVYPSECRYNKAGHALPPSIFTNTKRRIPAETYAFADTDTKTDEVSNDKSSRYYSSDNSISLDKLLVKTQEAINPSDAVSAKVGPSQSKVTDYYKPDVEMEDVSSTQYRPKKGQLRSSPILDSIEEESLSPTSQSSLAQGVSDLVMPKIYYWTDEGGDSDLQTGELAAG